MKKPALILSILFILLAAGLQAQSERFVAAASGLNLRSAAGTGGEVLLKIPFGAKVQLLPDHEQTPYESQELTSYWQKVSYQGKSGYVVNAYISRIAPPKASETLEAYLARTTTKAGELHYQNSSDDNESDAEFYYRSDRVLYSNFITYSTQTGYEWYENRLLIEDMSLAQAFVFVRALQAEFGDVFTPAAYLPKAGTTYTRTLQNENVPGGIEAEYTVTGIMSDCSENAYTKGFRIDHTAYGVYGYLEIRYEYNYVEIVWGAGV